MEIKSCSKCKAVTWIDDCFNECDLCLGGGKERKNERKKQREKELNKKKREKRLLLSIGRATTFLFISFLFFGCLASSKDLKEVKRNAVLQAKVTDAIAKDHLSLTKIVAKIGNLTPEQTQILLKNPSEIVENTDHLIDVVKESENKKNSVFSFDGVTDIFFSLANYIEPAITFIGSAVGIPAPIAGGVATALMGGIHLYKERRKRIALEEKDEEHQEIMKQKQKESEIKVAIAQRLDPKISEEYNKAKQEVLKDIKD